MNNESITLSLEDSFFLEKGKEATVEDYFKNIDERVNIKIAQGMKQAMHLIIKKLDVLIQNRLTYMVKDEVKMFALDFKCPCADSNTCKNAPKKPDQKQQTSTQKKQAVKFAACPPSIPDEANQSLPIPICSIISPQSPAEQPIMKLAECSGIASDGGALNPNRTSNSNLLNLSHSQRQGSIETRKSVKSMVSDSELFITKTPTLGARLRDDDRDQYLTQGAQIPRADQVTEGTTVNCLNRVSDLDDRRLALKLVPEKAKTPLITQEMQQAQNDKLSQLIKSPMSSIAENNIEEEIKLEPQHFVESHLQKLTQSTMLDQQNMLITDSIIQIDTQPTIETNHPNLLDGNMQIDVGIPDNQSSKTHHKRSSSSNLVDVKLPQVIMNHSSVEIENTRTNSNSELQVQQHKLAKSPTSTSLSRRSRQSILEGINSSQKYAKNLSKKYIQKQQEQDNIKQNLQNNTQCLFNNNDLSQLSLNQSAVKSPSPSRHPPSLIKIKSMLIESQTKSSGTGFQTARKRDTSRINQKDNHLGPNNTGSHRNVNFGNDIQITNMQDQKRHCGGNPSFSKKESDYSKFASDQKSRRPQTQRDLTQNKATRTMATCRKTIFDQPSSASNCAVPPHQQNSSCTSFSKKLSYLPDLRDSTKTASKITGAQIARENQTKARMAAKNSKKAAAMTAVVEDTPIGCAIEIKDRDQARNLKWSHENSKQCSATQDIVDEIYFEKDPIGVSLARRRRGDMPVTTVVRDSAQRHIGRFFFYLRLRGPGEPSTVDHSNKERHGNHRPVTSRQNIQSRNQNNASTIKNLHRDTSIPKINQNNPLNRAKDKQPTRNSSISKIPSIRSSSNLKKVEAELVNGNDEQQSEQLKDAYMRRKESEYLDQKRLKRDAIHLKSDLQQIELEAPPPTEQRVSIIDSMTIVCPDNSDDQLSTQQTSDGLKQSMSNHCDSKSQNMQAPSNNLQQKLEIADIDFSVYCNQNKTQEELDQIVPLVKQSFLSENLDDDGILVLASLMQLEFFSKDEPIIRYGEPGDKFYILTNGSTAQVILYEPGTNPMDRRLEDYRIMTKIIGEGEGFGELSILNNEPRTASVIAMNDDCQAYSVDSVVFKAMVSHSIFESSAKLAQQLNKVPMLRNYDNYFKLQLAQDIREVTYKHDDFIFHEGEESSTFFIVLDGEVECLKHYEDDEKQGFIRVRDIKQSDHFGELGILSHRPRSMSIRVITKTCTVAQFSKEAFSRIVFQIEQNLNKDYQQIFDKQFREVVQSKNASRFPLNQVFSDYNLKYITKKNISLKDGPSAPNATGQIITSNAVVTQPKKQSKAGHQKNNSILNVNHQTAISGPSNPGPIHNGKIIEKKHPQTNRQSLASVANNSNNINSIKNDNNTPEMAKSQISQSIMSSNQAAPPQFIH